MRARRMPSLSLRREEINLLSRVGIPFLLAPASTRQIAIFQPPFQLHADNDLKKHSDTTQALHFIQDRQVEDCRY